MAKRLTLADVAQSLGVSKTLVSLVINNKADAHGISLETQMRVIEKIRELNYQPNVLAQGFRTGKTKTIGLIVSDISNIFYAKIARQLEDYAWSKGYSVVICSSDENPAKEKEQIKLLLNRKVDGLIISSSLETKETFDQLIDSGFPHVLLDRTFQDSKSPSVTVNNHEGGRLAASHLLAQGYRSFAIICISPNHLSTISDRSSGFTTALAEAGIRIPDNMNIKVLFNNAENQIQNKLAELFQNKELPQAIFTLNNNLTTASLKQLHLLGIRVPEDVALIGFDDLNYFEFIKPSVSVIEQPIESLSEHAFNLLYRQIQKEIIENHECNIILPVKLIIRESSAIAPKINCQHDKL